MSCGVPLPMWTRALPPSEAPLGYPLIIPWGPSVGLSQLSQQEPAQNLTLSGFASLLPPSLLPGTTFQISELDPSL